MIIYEYITLFHFLMRFSLDVTPEGVEVAPPDAEHNIFNIWRHLLDENEKIAKARLAAVQVFQDHCHRHRHRHRHRQGHRHHRH